MRVEAALLKRPAHKGESTRPGEAASAASLEKVYQRVAHCGGVRQTLPEPAPDRVGAQPVTVRGANASN